MSKRLFRILISCLVPALPVLCGFDSCFSSGTPSSSPPPPGGFTVQVVDANLQGTTSGFSAGGQITGNYAANICSPITATCPQGSATSFGWVGDPHYVAGGKAPAFWQG